MHHLNLPVQITFVTEVIEYVYDATEIKLAKQVLEPNLRRFRSITHYAGAYQYEWVPGRNQHTLQFFSQPEGYVAYNNGTFSYIYQYKDHLGSNRLSYSDSNNDGQVTASEIVEKDNYYPFGMKHKEYNSIINGVAHKYKFQGQERQDELGLNWDSFKYRNYDYAIGRFMSIDPLAEKYNYQSPYNFSENKVVSHIELEGLEGLHHTLVDKAGNRSHIIEKNVVFLRQTPQTIPAGASPRQAERITTKNMEVTNKEYNRIQTVKSELSSFYGGEHKNSSGESVKFKINFSEMSTNNSAANGKTGIISDNKGIHTISHENGLLSGEKLGETMRTAPAAIFTSDTNIGSALGLTLGANKVFVSSPDAPSGSYAHEFIHTLGLPDNGYDKGGILGNPPEALKQTEIDEIIRKSYDAQ